MANPLKDILKIPVPMIKSLESKLPSGLPKISEVMDTASDVIPDLPDMGGMMKSSKIGGFNLSSPLEIVKSIEEMIPNPGSIISKVEQVKDGILPKEVRPTSKLIPLNFE